MTWLQLKFSLHQVNLIDELLTELGALAVTLTDAGDHPIFEPPPGETPLWPGTTITALFPIESNAESIEKALRNSIDEVGLKFEFEELADQDWVTLGQSGWAPMCFGQRLWVCTAADQEQLPSNAIAVLIEPGLAFGTGSHPTTSLCLQWLDHNPPLRKRVIDYGCGSGILALACAKLGASHVLVTDIDAQALDATEENARRNQCAESLQRHDVDACIAAGQDHPADLLLANILAAPLMSLANRLSDMVKPGGQIVLSGILREQAADVAAAYRGHFGEMELAVEGDWVRLVGTRIAQPSQKQNKII